MGVYKRTSVDETENSKFPSNSSKFELFPLEFFFKYFEFFYELILKAVRSKITTMFLKYWIIVYSYFNTVSVQNGRKNEKKRKIRKKILLYTHAGFGRIKFQR